MSQLLWLFCSVARSYLSLCSPVNCSTPIFPALHYLLEFAQIHFHWVRNAIAPLNKISFCPIYWSLSSAHQQSFMNLTAAGTLEAADGLLYSLSFLSHHILHQLPTYPKCGSWAFYREWVTMFNKSQPIPLGCSPVVIMFPGWNVVCVCVWTQLWWICISIICFQNGKISLL